MSNSNIPDEVVVFLETSIRELTELEIVLLLYRAKHRLFSATSIAAELQLEPEDVTSHLERLAVGNLVDVRVANDMLYHIAELRPAHEAALAILTTIYPARHLSIAKLISAHPAQSASLFADAFLVRRAPKNSKDPKGKK